MISSPWQVGVRLLVPVNAFGLIVLPIISNSCGESIMGEYNLLYFYTEF